MLHLEELGFFSVVKRGYKTGWENLSTIILESAVTPSATKDWQLGNENKWNVLLLHYDS